jgi:hypothetical protein
VQHRQHHFGGRLAAGVQVDRDAAPLSMTVTPPSICSVTLIWSQ